MPDPGGDRDHPNLAAPRVARNTLFLALTDIGNKVMAFVFFALAARHLGTEKFGTFSFALAIATMLTVFADLGLGSYSARVIARSPLAAGRYLGSGLAIKVTAAALLSALICAVIKTFGHPTISTTLAAVMGLVVLSSAVVFHCAAVFQGLERMELTAVTRVAQTVILLVGGYVLGRGPALTMRYAWLYVGAGFVAALVSVSVASGVVGLRRVSVAFSDWVAMLRAAIPFGLASILVVIYYWNGTGFLSMLSGDGEVGLYSAAFRLVLGVGFLSYAFSGAMYPVMSRLHVGSPERLRAGFTASLRLVIGLAAPLCVYGVLLADRIVSFVYGAQYVGAVPALRLLSVWGGLAALNSMLSNYLYAVDMPRSVVTQSAVALMVSVGLNLVLVRPMGAVGVALSIAAAELVAFVYLVFAQRRTATRASTRSLAKSLGVSTLAAVLSAVVVLQLATALHLLAALSIGVLLYAVLLVALGGIERSEALMIRRVVTRRQA